jgi:hypothetical protein
MMPRVISSVNMQLICHYLLLYTRLLRHCLYLGIERIYAEMGVPENALVLVCSGQFNHHAGAEWLSMHTG